MQGYSPGFSRLYNLRWGGFAQYAASHILDFYAATATVPNKAHILDLCCGTGQFARCCLEQGYAVTGIDLSEAMLKYAQENTAAYIQSGQAQFICANAGAFALKARFGLVVSTFDALNHLADETALQSCFKRVFAVCDGYFIFDLNTPVGLRQWNNLQVDDAKEDAFILSRGIYDGQPGSKAWTRITGFVRNADGTYERVDETAYNTVFDLAWVKQTLLEIGWQDVYAARLQDLKTPLAEPEKEGRVFFVARR
ncbi:MAG TPA: class I SAM-dependent methyltransferase [Phototrophicaceae bacterium]|nr:class I SAM-dependent methyltransferase [Phototrophicaceae bacterium]